MLKRVAILSVFFGLVFVQMSYHQEASAQQHAKGSQSEPPASVTINNDDHSSHEQKKENDIPRWWPEGITSIAVILTLVAISVQTYYTRKAAEATRVAAEGVGKQSVLMKRQADLMEQQATHMESQLQEMERSREINNKTLILQYRPKIIVRFASASEFNLAELGKPSTAKVRITIVNTGGSPAHITGGDIALWLVKITDANSTKVAIHKGAESQIAEGTLEPGQRYRWEETLDMDAINDLQWMSYHEGIATDDHRSMILVGTINYVDDLSIPRSTGIYRNYSPKTRDFKAADVEGEYDD